MSARAILGYGLLAALAVVLDQWIKHLVVTGLALHEAVELLPFLALYRTYNNGIAFSMLSSIGDTGLILIVVVVVGFILYLLSRTTKQQYFARIGFALVIGGAIGNLIDRVMLGHVVDYILFHTPVWSFAVFNLADAFITIGAGLVILEELLGWRRERASDSSRTR